MTIIRIFSYVAVVATIAACVAGAPVQNQAENVFTQPELAEVLARTYEAIEWQRNQDKQAGEIRSRNLDHIGGGNLLRRVTSGVNEPELNYELFGGEDSFREMNKEPYRQSRSAGSSHLNLDPIGGGNIVRRDAPNEYERNLDHIGGSNLLRNVNGEGHSPRGPIVGTGGIVDSLGGGNLVGVRYSERNLDHIGGSNLLRNVNAEGRRQREPMVGTGGIVDPLGGGNLVGLVPYSDRNLDHIGGSNLLRDLEVAPYSEDSYRNRRAPVEASQSSNRRNQSGNNNYDATRGTLDSIGGGNFVRRDVDRSRQSSNQKNQSGNNNYDATRGTLDSIGGGNLVGLVSTNEYDRNLDHIGGSNLLRNLEVAPYSETDSYRHRRTPAEGQSNNQNNQSRKNDSGYVRGTLDSLGGGNTVRRDVTTGRNLDHIGGGNLLR